MKVALVHDWITGMRGGEKCLQDFLTLYPDADVYTLLHKRGVTTPQIDARVVQTSILQNIPSAERYYKALLPFYPMAAKSLKIKGYDLVVSLSHAAAKNISLEDNAFHISYCFTPMRYIWDQAPQYFGRSLPLAWPLIKGLRAWDVEGSKRVTAFVGISSFVAARIRCFYGRKSDVIYPAVDTAWIKPAKKGTQGDFFLYAGATVPYKRVDLVIEACNRLQLPLYIAAEESAALKKIAGSTVKFVGKPSNAELAELYRSCRALIFPGKEDFGMVPVECLSAGRPVIGLGSGGLKETINGIKHWECSGIKSEEVAQKHFSGVFIQDRYKKEEEMLQAVIAAVAFFRDHEEAFDVEDCVKQARCFAPQRFFSSWQALLQRCKLG